MGASYYNGLGKAIKPSADYIGQSQARNRLGFEASYTTPRLSLKGEYIQGNDGSTEKEGWYATGRILYYSQKLAGCWKI